jgi:proteasome lid subunit RPN8/RPN11
MRQEEDEEWVGVVDVGTMRIETMVKAAKAERLWKRKKKTAKGKYLFHTHPHGGRPSSKDLYMAAFSGYDGHLIFSEPGVYYLIRRVSDSIPPPLQPFMERLQQMETKPPRTMHDLCRLFDGMLIIHHGKQ